MKNLAAATPDRADIQAIKAVLDGAFAHGKKVAHAANVSVGPRASE